MLGFVSMLKVFDDGSKISKQIALEASCGKALDLL